MQQLMASTVIKWSKKYYEELGTPDQDGFYDYAYRYFVYSFYLPGEDRIVLRNYVDSSLEGNLFVYKGGMLDKKDEVDKELISAVIAFMYKKQNVIHFNRFNGGYKPIDLAGLKDNCSNFFFAEIKVTE